MPNELPDGYFKDVLAANQGMFPDITQEELDSFRATSCLQDAIPVRATRYGAYGSIYESLSATSSLFGIPAPNLYIVPTDAYHVFGMLCGDSSSLILAANFGKVQDIDLSCTVDHEFGHGIQGKLVKFAMDNWPKDESEELSDKVKNALKCRELHSDAIAAWRNSPAAVKSSIENSIEDRLGRFSFLKRPDFMNEESVPHYPSWARRISNLEAMDKSATWKDFVSGNKPIGELIDHVPFVHR